MEDEEEEGRKVETRRRGKEGRFRGGGIRLQRRHLYPL